MNLYFTYRWLLLECKREFPFNDALRILEVMWATLPIDSEPPALCEASLATSPSDTLIADSSSPAPVALAQRRAQSCPQLSTVDECPTRKSKQRSSLTISHMKEHLSAMVETRRKHSDGSGTFDNDEYACISSPRANAQSGWTRSRERSMENSFSLSEISEFDSEHLSTNATNNGVSAPNAPATSWLDRLPGGDTTWMEEDNLFLIFVCVSILLDHRKALLRQPNLDEQDISMHFDRYRRRHNATKILHCSRALYAQYIQWARKKRMIDDLNRFSTS